MVARTREEKNQTVIDIEGFLGASSMPDRAELMGQLQIGSGMLDEGRKLISEWHERRALLDQADLKLVEVSKEKRAARKVAALEMTALIMLFRRQYYRDEGLLRSLGLGPKRQTVPTDGTQSGGRNGEGQTGEGQTGEGQTGESQTGGGQTGESQAGDGENASSQTRTHRVAVTKSQRESERLTLWRSILGCIPGLRQDVRDRLILVGFDETRLDAISAAVEAFAATIPIKNVAMAERKERTRLANLTEWHLNNWLVTLRALMAPKIRLLRDQGQSQFLALLAI